MKYTPLSIKSQQFKKVVRGFDKDEVQVFLDRLADEFEKLSGENETLKKDLEKANARISEFRKIEKNLQDTLLKAHESSSKAVESAKKQTALIMKEAELKAAQIVEKAKSDADKIRNAVLALREERNLIIAKLKALLNSQASLLEMKLENSGREVTEKDMATEKKAPEAAENLNLNIDDILEKLL
ncbi:MAG: DivIVA domain-containing protein [Ignavibacteria bacterium]|jgi:cell division initiation protein|nr:DivIVA domain-containing protein [Ignavibacteria bacterium]MCU7502404.1 DivIVA domain-containing protein [Ignavibacteria bacterium]MCU7515031.1 DivIVA domain-containing protein [Ignavibacteria bacterium]